MLHTKNQTPKVHLWTMIWIHMFVTSPSVFLISFLLFIIVYTIKSVGFEDLWVSYSFQAHFKYVSTYLQFFPTPSGCWLTMIVVLKLMWGSQKKVYRISDFVIEKRVLECAVVAKACEYMGRAKREGIDTMFKCPN